MNNHPELAGRSFIDPSGSGQGDSLIIPNHLRQMKLWGIRQGIEVYPKQDTPDRSRSKFIQRQWKANKLDLYLPAIFDQLLCSGSILWYFAPTGSGTYAISWYPQFCYRAYYDIHGIELIKVIFKSNYVDNSNFQVFGYKSKNKWLKVTVTAQKIDIEAYETEPSIDPSQDSFNTTFPTSRQSFPNVLGFMPCSESCNLPTQKGSSGVSEFEIVKNQLSSDNSIRAAMLDNIQTFGNPTLVTSKSADAVMEARHHAHKVMENGYLQHNFASQNGYQNSLTLNTARSLMKGVLSGTQYGAGNGVGIGGRGRKVASVIGGIKENERFAYLQVDPISSDQWEFTRDYGESIHEALGGIDPQGRTRTFGEIKSLSGKVAATAAVKSTALWEHGLCVIFERMIQAEEQLFLVSYGQQLIEKKYVKDPTQLTPDLVENAYYDHGLQLPAIGLCPFGTTAVNWRHKGPVFENSPQDILQLSIVTRNLQELGVGSIEALKYLFPDKTNEEIETLLTGIPFRYLSQSIQSLQSLLQLQQTMYGLPDPLVPNQPLGVRLSVDRIIEYALKNLEREISYGQKYEPTAAGSSISTQRNSISSADSNVSSPAGVPGESPSNAGGTVDIPGSIPAPGANLVPGSGGTELQPVGISTPRSSTAPRATVGLPTVDARDYNAGIPATAIPTDLAEFPGILAAIYPEIRQLAADQARRSSGSVRKSGNGRPVP